jgi:hypothetical protein
MVFFQTVIAHAIGGRKLSKENKTETFEQILLEAVDEVLLSLGETLKTTILFHLEENFKVRHSDIPSRIADFADALEIIVGRGAKLLEIMIMENLNAKIGVTCKWSYDESPSGKQLVPELTFQEYIGLMRQNFEAKNEDKIKIGFLVDSREK